jgi:hypothetical protein
MQRFSTTVTALLGGVVLSLMCASTASATCVAPTSVLPLHPSLMAGRLAPSNPRLTAGGAAPAGHSSDDDASVVGLWHFVFTSLGNDVEPFNIPDGAPLDMGYAQWHSDQTEIMNSFRDPATSNFCLGVWAATGKGSYKLNHFALSWDNTGHFCTPPAGAPSCFVGVTNIREEITVGSHGNSYDGNVTIIQYREDGTEWFRLTGTVSAQRLTAD